MDSEYNKDQGHLLLGIPSGGRLSEKTMELFSSAELPLTRLTERSYSGRGKRWDRLHVRYLRPTDIARFVANNVLDIGVSAENIVAETEVAVRNILPLNFGNCRIILAAKRGMKRGKLNGKIIATSYPRLTKRYCEKNGITPHIIEADGAVEAYPSLGLAAGIVDVTETGTTLRENGLDILDVLMRSTAVLVAKTTLTPAQEENLQFLKESLEGVLKAKQYKRVKGSFSKVCLEEFLAICKHYENKGKQVTNLEIHDDGGIIRFELNANIDMISKFLRVLKHGKSSSTGTSQKSFDPITNLTAEVSDISLII